MTDIKYDIESIIRKKRLLLFGHVCRLPNNHLVKRSLKEDFKKKTWRGRPPKR